MGTKAIGRIGLAGVLLVLLARKAEAEQLPWYPTIGVTFRTGNYFVFEPGIVHIGAPGKSGRVLAPMVRGQIGVGGSGVGMGLVTNMIPTPELQDIRDLIFAGPILLEARVERTYGSSSWRHTTYAGPQVSFNVPIVPKFCFGWMIDVHDAAYSRLQIGAGFGF